MKVLGISCYYHDSAAALIADGEVVAAAEEERFSRKKHDFDFPKNSISFCLEWAGMNSDSLDAVVFYEKPLTKFHRMVHNAALFEPDSWKSFAHRLIRHRQEGIAVEPVFRRVFGYTGRFLFSEHHLSHGASSFFCSPFNRAAVVTIDGVGEMAATTIGRAEGPKYEILSELHYPNSLGLFYSAMTAFLGFEVNNDEYTVMGLAAYGQPRFMQELGNVLHVEPDGRIRNNLEYFNYHRSDRRMFAPAMELLLGPARVPGAETTQRHMDLAASVQSKLEEALSSILERAYRETKETNLCLAGGVALNGVANWRSFRSSPFQRIFVQPAAGDSGGAIGAALQAYYQITGEEKSHFSMFSPYLGPEYSDTDISEALRAHGSQYRRLEDDELFRFTAQKLADSQVVGWFQGRMEFGPRALGSRSILANPADPGMKDHINSCIKFREEFRPFAPAVPEEDADDFFDLHGHSSPYMLLVPEAKTTAKKRIPAVIHVDNTARVQTVSSVISPRFHRLLGTFAEISGIPVVLNTSFNVKGEPIVCSPVDAIRCFSNTNIDVLVMNNYVMEKNV
jgi:carbamoyltransferase